MIGNTLSTKTCAGCKETKSATEFWRDGKGRDGRRSRCKKCLKLPRQPRRPDIPWVQDRVALLKELFEKEGLCRRVIADRLGITRNAVIGKLYRMGLSDRCYDGPTTMDRLDALHKAMDSALAEYALVKTKLSQCQPIEWREPSYANLPRMRRPY